MIKKAKIIQEYDFDAHKNDFQEDVVKGLSQDQKFLPSIYFYDERGSHLFNRICETEDYYVTRTEIQIMKDHAKEIAQCVRENCMLIEYGSGSGEKTRLLLDHLENPLGYIPIDISLEHLEETAAQLNHEYPQLEVVGLCADFTEEFTMPSLSTTTSQRVVYFPGSTIGNFDKDEALSILKDIFQHCQKGDGAFIGFDLIKDEDILLKAYNDSEGITEAFNLNLLNRINTELGADFSLDHFEHKAIYNKENKRMEMHLVSRADQEVKMNKHRFTFEKGETIHTESSHKYSIEDIEFLAKEAGLTLAKFWTDKQEHFCVAYLTI